MDVFCTGMVSLLLLFSKPPSTTLTRGWTQRASRGKENKSVLLAVLALSYMVCLDNAVQGFDFVDRQHVILVLAGLPGNSGLPDVI